MVYMKLHDYIIGSDFINMVSLVTFDVKGHELMFNIDNQ